MLTEKVHRKFNETSIDLSFLLQEMPACAVDDAYIPGMREMLCTAFWDPS